MRNVVALVDRDTALGFRLAGIAGRSTETPADLERASESLLADPEVRLVLVDESLFRRLPERLQRKLSELRSPVFVPIPAFRPAERALKPEEYVARLMRRAIGYQIKIRR